MFQCRCFIVALVVLPWITTNCGRGRVGRLTPEEKRAAALIEELRSGKPRAPGRKEPQIADDLVAIGPPAVPLLIEVTGEGPLIVRQYVIYTLGRIGDDRAVDPLLAALRDPHEGIRSWAAASLGDIGDARAIPRLRRAVQNDASYLVRVESVYALRNIGGSDAFQGVRGALKDKDALVRKAAALSLGDMPACRPNVLKAVLEDPHAEVRVAALESLGKIGGSGDIQAIRRLFQDDRWMVRRAAILAIRKIGGAGAAKAIEGALRDKHWRVCQMAAWQLGEIGGPDAAKALKAALEEARKRKDRAQDVRYAIERALKKIQDRQNRTD